MKLSRNWGVMVNDYHERYLRWLFNDACSNACRDGARVVDTVGWETLLFPCLFRDGDGRIRVMKRMVTGRRSYVLAYPTLGKPVKSVGRPDPVRKYRAPIVEKMKKKMEEKNES